MPASQRSANGLVFHTSRLVLSIHTTCFYMGRLRLLLGGLMLFVSVCSHGVRVSPSV